MFRSKRPKLFRELICLIFNIILVLILPFKAGLNLNLYDTVCMSRNRFSNFHSACTFIQVVHTEFIKVVRTEYSPFKQNDPEQAAATIMGTRYSRIDQVRFVEDSL